MTDDPAIQLHLETTDFKGNRVVCTELQWVSHLLDNKRHIDMEDQEELVIAALQKPATGVRYHDTVYPRRMIYYGEGGIAKYIKVTVEFEEDSCNGVGFIKTAYLTNNMKPGEVMEWPKK